MSKHPHVEPILIIDDDTELCEMLTTCLAAEGFRLDSAHEAEEGVKQALSGRYSLVILDVMLPGASGVNVLRKIREYSRVPVVMLTARGDESDRVTGLEFGADDYLAKPFGVRELVARIRAVLRRVREAHLTPSSIEPFERICIGDLELNEGTRRVYRRGEAVELTGVEFDVLAMLVRSAGRAVSRDEIGKRVLGRSIQPYDRSVDVHVSSLRRKLGPLPGGIERIQAIRGQGYFYARSD